jgi:SP family galactose:H+ symporter-like MFS transporter
MAQAGLVGAKSGGYKTIVYVISSVAALGGLLFGLDQGFIANSLGTIQQHYHFGVQGGERYSSILATGGIAGALLSGLFARFLGRKRSLLFAGFIFTAASAFSALLPPLPVLSACRFGLGFGVGIASFIVPLFLSETAPASIRGSMGTLFQLMITIGIFLISLTNVVIARAFVNPATSLPLMFLTITLFAALMFLGGFMLPESPRWLMLKGRREAAVAVLRRTLNTQDEIDLEIEEIEQALHGRHSAGVGIVLRGYFMKVLAVGVLLQVFQQLVGINMMIYYSPTIFGYAGIKGWLAAMTVPTVNMLFTFPAIRLVEKWGRKKLLYVGAITMFVTMIAAGVAFEAVGSVSDPAMIGGARRQCCSRRPSSTSLALRFRGGRSSGSCVLKSSRSKAAKSG